MLLGKKFEAFVQASPVSVMLRGILERFLDAKAVDRFFESTAVVQYTVKLTFSRCVQIMSDVVFRTAPSINAWCQDANALGCTRQAVYQKIRLIEPHVAAGLVDMVANRARTTISALRMVRSTAKTSKAILPGYRVRILDGSHLPGTEHRLKVLWAYRAAALP